METKNPYINIFQDFQANNIKYLVVGGYAALFYGTNRMTIDMDIIVDLKMKNLKGCLNVLKKNGFMLSHPYIKESDLNPKNILIWIREKNMKALRFENKSKPFLMFDIVLDLPKAFGQLYSNGLKHETEKSSLYFIGKEDLIDMKAKAGRLQDYQDNFAMTGNAAWLGKIKEKFASEKE
jgi:hypothetical protein